MNVKSAPVDQAVSIERLSGLDSWPFAERLLREYLPWVIGKMVTDCGARFDDNASEIEIHHSAFAREADQMLKGKGFLLLARLRGEPVGMIALKHVQDDCAEIKRMYVSPVARGHGIGRTLLQQLLGDARTLGYRTVRLETMAFMRDAAKLYASLGFQEGAAFEDSQSALSGVTPMTRFMTLAL
jgi:GNAT superfamily N-acetyltransferase